MTTRTKSTSGRKLKTGREVQKAKTKKRSHQLCLSKKKRDRTQDKELPNPRYKRDVVLFREFVSLSLKSAKLANHQVMRTIVACARVVARKYHCLDSEGDLINETFMSLRKQSHYEGRSSLKTYILVTLDHKALALNSPPVPGKFIYLEHDDETGDKWVSTAWQYDQLDDDLHRTRRELPDKSTLNHEANVVAALCMEECMNKLMTLPEIHRLVVQILKDEEREEDDEDDIGCLGRRRIAEKASRKLGRTVTRHEVTIVLKQLQPVFAELLRP